MFRCDEKQIVFLTVPHSAGRANHVINSLCSSADRTVVFGGIASGGRCGRARTERSTSLFHTDGCDDSGALFCTLTPTGSLGQQLDAVVVSATAKIGPVFKVTEAEAGEQGGTSFTLINSVQDPANPAAELVPLQAVQSHGHSLSDIAASDSITPSGQLAAPIRSLDSIQGHQGALVATTPSPVGSYIQAEVMEPKIAAENTQAALKALASDADTKRQEAADGHQDGGATAEADDSVMEVARSSSRARGVNAAAGYFEEEAMFAAGGGLLFSCLGRSGNWYRENGMAANFEPDSFSAAFKGKALAGFLGNGEIFGEKTKPPAPAKAESEALDMSDPSEVELSAMSVKELKAIMGAAGVDYSDCLEKSGQFSMEES